MTNLAVRSFATFGYFAATLLIAIVAVLFLTSLGDDSSGSQAADTTTPTPTQAGPPNDSNVRIDPTCAEASATHVYSDAAVTIPGISVRNTLTAGVLAGDKATGDETPDCPLTFD